MSIGPGRLIMWLKTSYLGNLRALTYSYGAKLAGGEINQSVDHDTTFIQQLENVKTSEEVEWVWRRFPHV